MRTTINIDEQLYIATKKLAAQSKQTMTSVIEDALRVMLLTQKREQRKVKLNTFNGDGLKHGVDIDDNNSLLDIMDNK